MARNGFFGRILAAVLVVLCLAAAARADDGTQAKLLGFEAALKFAQAVRSEDPHDRAGLLDEADALFARIVELYPDTAEAKNIATGGKVAGVSAQNIADAKEAVAALIEERTISRRGSGASCLSSPTAECLFQMAFDAAGGISRANDRDLVLADIARLRAGLGDMNEALALAASLRPLPVGNPTLVEVIGLQAAAGDAAGALTAAEAIADPDYRGRARLAVLAALLEAGERQRALDMLPIVEAPAARAEAEAMLAADLARAGQAAPAKQGFHSAVDLANGIADSRTRERALAGIARALAAAQDFTQAASVASWIIEPARRGAVSADILEARAAAGDAEGAVRMLRLLDQEKPRANLLERVTQGFVAAGRADFLADLLNAVDARIGRGQVLATLANMAPAADWAAALRAAAPAIEDPAHGAWARAIAARVLASAGQAAPARAALAEAAAAGQVLTPRDRGNALLESAAAQVYLGDLEAARRLLTELPAGLVWDRGVTGLIGALAAHPDPAQAFALLQVFGYETDRARLLRALAVRRAELGDIAGALEIVETIAPPRERDDAFFGIAKQRLAAGDRQGAQQTLARAETLRDDGFLLRDFGGAQARSGDITGALATAERVADPANLAYLYADIAAALTGKTAADR